MIIIVHIYSVICQIFFGVKEEGKSLGKAKLSFQWTHHCSGGCEAALLCTVEAQNAAHSGSHSLVS